jgi:glycosyltransferase involved in cell wall biosynthesis
MFDRTGKQSKRRRVLFINDGSLTNPILSSQGLPHLARLADRGYAIFVLSTETEKDEFEQEIYERVLRKYSGSLHFLPVRPLPAWLMMVAIQMLILGPFITMFYVLKYRIGIIHARSYIPCIAGHLSKCVLGTKLIFDMRGLMIDEFISKGQWREAALGTRIMRYWEKKNILLADAIVVVSERFREYVCQLPYAHGRALPITVIPNCVDFEAYDLDASIRSELIEKYRLDGRTVFVYSGSLASWQSCEEIANFFAFVRYQLPKAFLLFVTYGRGERLEALLKKLGLPIESYAFTRTFPEEVPTYLSLGHAGILFRKDELLNNVASPLKFAEYLAAGVPVLLTRGIGDTEKLVTECSVGVIVGTSSENELKAAATHVVRFLQEDRSLIGERCRAVAREKFSLSMAVENYHDIYTNIFDEAL